MSDANVCSFDGEQKSVTLRLKDLLVFITGVDRIPPLGFGNVAGVNFLHDQGQRLPMASTCTPCMEGIISVFGFGLM